MNRSSKRPVCRETVLVGSLPPPITGQTLAFQAAFEGMVEREFPCKVIDLSGGDHMRVEGGFSLGRLRRLIGPFCLGAYLFLTGKRTLYLSCTQSWVGFLRDGVFILLAAVRRNRIVLHSQGGNYDGFYSTLSSGRKGFVRAILRHVSVFLVLGRALVPMFRFDSRFPERTHVVFNGLPYRPDAATGRSKTLPETGRPKILYLSNLIVSKGYLQVLDALRILVKERKIEVEGHFCGSFILSQDICPYNSEQEAEADFLERIAKAGLERHVFWHGTVSGERKVSFLGDSHFFVLPTIYRYEGMPISIIEALAYGLVVLSTAHRTIPEILENGKAGDLVSFDRPETIADTIETYVRDPERFAVKSRAAVDRYLEVFTREAYLDRLIPYITDTK